MKKLFALVMFFVPAMLFAAIGDNGISVAPDGTTLKWEEGKWDFFIMHKSLLERSPENLTNSEAKNPQADTCMDPAVGSTYTLTSKHIPDDADIDRAFLIWLSAQDPDNLEGKTDNEGKIISYDDKQKTEIDKLVNYLQTQNYVKQDILLNK